MAYIRTEASHIHNEGPGIFARMGRAIGDWFSLVIESQSRLHEVERLQNKSDAELARMGLTRNAIVHHVFRDRMMY